MGRIPGHGNFHSLKRNSTAKPIKNTVIYRFGGNLFFANIDLFCREIEEALKEDTKQIVVDARGIGNIDITAAERLVMFHKELKNRGIKFYLTEHDGSLNDQLKKLGAESLIEEGAVRHTITLALKDAGLEKPYTLEENTEMEKEKKETFFNDSVEEKALAAEREWLHGKADGSKL
jgi:MFS superfamily sulfate permease-like transporter